VLNWIVAGEGRAPHCWFAGKPDDVATADEILRHWQALARLAGEELSLQPRPPGPMQVARLPGPPPGLLRAASPPKVAQGWRSSSFSGLMLGLRAARDTVGAPDHDADVAQPMAGTGSAHPGSAQPAAGPGVGRVDAPGPPAADGQPTPGEPGHGALDPRPGFLEFPAGPSAGECLHAMFERIDFADPVDGMRRSPRPCADIRKDRLPCPDRPPSRALPRC
jgi:exodeoxyribonuclease V beta subunit